MKIKSALIAIFSLVLLAGCVSSGPAPTTVDLAITGAANMNGGAPAKVKIYYLASASTFNSSDFFSLFNSANATLGTDLIAVDEFQLAPGRTQTDVRTVTGTPAAIGVVAAFRDIDGARFKAVKRLNPNAENTVRVTISGTTVSVR